MRTAKINENFSDIDKALTTGIMNHYSQVINHALQIQSNSNIPVIAMGHLFMDNSRTLTDEGERSLYVGTAVRIGVDIFPEELSYIALGHLHSPQYIGRKNIRYSGSPIAMTFAEAEGKKSVSIIEFDGKNVKDIHEINVPVFQELKHISGTISELTSYINNYGASQKSIWLDVSYTGKEFISNLQEIINDCAKNYDNLEILGVHDESKKSPGISTPGIPPITLDDIKPETIFSNLMKDRGFAEDKQKIYMDMFIDIVRKIEEGSN